MQEYYGTRLRVLSSLCTERRNSGEYLRLRV